MVFIKGVPDQPKCKFSKEMVKVLTDINVKFSSIDILEKNNKKLKEWLKYFSKWKTYPEVYINGKIVGGLDSTKKLIEDKKFLPMVPNEFKQITVEEKL